MLILETGEGLPNANSYADDTMATTYCETRGLEWIDQPQSKREIALIRATDYIDRNYVFRSLRHTEEQGLECPRYEQAISHKLIKAAIELAVIALREDIFTPRDNRVVTSESESLSSLTITTSYQVATPPDPYPSITRLLSGVATRRNASASWFMVGA